ncbi:MAG: Cas10/Cmr2 second palm domain-containing protein [Gemmobacter sp.]
MFSDALRSGDDTAAARDAARNAMSDDGPVRGVALPLGSPMVRPAPRSGGSPAILAGWAPYGTCPRTREYADLATHLVRRHLEEEREGLAAKFMPADDSQGKALRWPTVFEADDQDSETKSDRTVVFPFQVGMIRRIAVLHADGNGMGTLFKRAVDEYRNAPDKVRDLSRALAKATQGAVRHAMKAVADAAAEGVMPARPVLLGGDDVSLILRADLAPQFALDFAEAFEGLATKAARPFNILAKNEIVTIKVGFVVISPNQPFSQAYDLAESLATSARHKTESRIAFHRVAGATIPASARDLADGGRGDGGYTLWQAAHPRKGFEVLIDLAKQLDKDDVGRGGLRRVAELLKSNREEAKRVLDRAMEVLGSRPGDMRKQLETTLSALGMNGLDAWTGTTPRWCPLLQAHDLSHVLGKAA